MSKDYKAKRKRERMIAVHLIPALLELLDKEAADYSLSEFKTLKEFAEILIIENKAKHEITSQEMKVMAINKMIERKKKN